MSNFWHFYVFFIVAINIIFYGVLLFYTKNIKVNDTHEKINIEVSKYVEYHYSEIEELNEPLPKWWFWMFFVSILFSVLYLICYPGAGKYSGIFNWTSDKECSSDVIKYKNLCNDLYKSYKNVPVELLSKKADALKIGRNLFLNNCSSCHGYDATGSKNFPNLTNNIWLYGGKPEEIKESITKGRNGVMPAFGFFLNNEEDIRSVALYVSSFSMKYDCDSATLEKGKNIFQKICFVCHGSDARGDKIKGAPSFVEPQWIYGSSLDDIIYTIKNGRSGKMPSHENILTEDQIHILTSYIYSLNNK